MNASPFLPFPPPLPSPRRFSALFHAITAVVALLVSVPSCDSQESTITESSESTENVEHAPATAKRSTKSLNDLRFVCYNVENWLLMDRNGKSAGAKPKPEEEKSHVIRILCDQQPDIVGLCEVGTKADLEEIQSKMKHTGVDLPHLHYHMGSDESRALGLLSRHPITSTDIADDLEYTINGKTFVMGRGILDATVDTGKTEIRFLGVHLKSKREIEEADQSVMRLNEARLLRRHVDSILEKDPGAGLVVYGDFNDTYPSDPVRAITSHPDPSMRIKPIYLRDSRQETWTHHWSYQDIYSRIDYVCVSHALGNNVEYKKSKIIDDPDWHKASDHRPLLLVFR